MMVREVINRLSGWFRTKAQERELNEEIRLHLEMATGENIKRGMSPQEARQAARCSFGVIEPMKEECRSQRGIPVIESLWRDFELGARMMAKTPRFTALVVLSLALGIGANTAVFSMVNAVLLRPLPFDEPERLFVITEQNLERKGSPQQPEFAHSYAWRKEDAIFENVALFQPYWETTTTWIDGRGERLPTQFVSPEIFETLGVSPLRGRGFSPEDITNGKDSSTIVISHGLWQRRFGGREDIIGQTLDTLQGSEPIIIGVMPPGFHIIPGLKDVDIWRAFYAPSNSNQQWAATVARLRPGVSAQQAEERCMAISHALESSTERSWIVRAEPFQAYTSAPFAESLYLLQGAVALVLLIACANVAGLLLGRGVSRRTEFATRKTLGAGRFHLARQLFAETLLLAIGGGVCGILIAWWGIQLFVAIAADFYPPTNEFQIDLAVLGMSVSSSLAISIIVGLFPALQSSRVDPNSALKGGTRTGQTPASQRLRGTLVAVQVALSVILLMGSGLMMNSLARMLNEQVGFDPDQLLTMQVDLTGRPRYVEYGVPTRIKPNAERFWTEAIEHLAGLPGVESVGMASTLPPYPGRRATISIPGRPMSEPSEQPTADIYEVNSEYFSTMRIRLLSGSLPTAQDSSASAGVAVVNDVFAKRYFPGEDAVGKRIIGQIGRAGYLGGIIPDRPREIVGVVQSERRSFRRRETPVLYIPYQQHFTEFPWGGFANDVHLVKGFVIRTNGDPQDLADLAREALATVDAGAVVSEIRTMRARIADSYEILPVRFWMRLLSLFSAMAVLLAIIGIYGVVSFSVAKRTHEFGIRAALGAGNIDIMKLAGKEAFIVVVGGVAVGLVAGKGLGRFIEHHLYGVSAADPLTIAMVVIVIVGAAFAASYGPARRAARVDPAIALRHE